MQVVKLQHKPQLLSASQQDATVQDYGWNEYEEE